MKIRYCPGVQFDADTDTLQIHAPTLVAQLCGGWMETSGKDAADFLMNVLTDSGWEFYDQDAERDEEERVKDWPPSKGKGGKR